MKTTYKQTLIAAALIGALALATVGAQAEPANEIQSNEYPLR